MSDPRSTSVSPRRLPQQPSLEQLKKQAKELLERFRASELAAVAEVRQFERKPDPSRFALNDAQRVLARAYGFESWPKLKAFVDGATIARFTDAVKAGDMTQVRSMLASRPELVGMDRAGNDEHRGLHYAVLSRNAPMVKLLMEAGADARKGIWPNRDATSALTLARDREYSDIVAIIEEEERLRRAEMSCPNATVSPVQDQISAAILQGDRATAMGLLEEDRSLIQACDRTGATPLHIAAQVADVDLVAWLLERRANVRKQNIRGSSALDRAAQSAEPRNDYAQRFPAVARLLLDHGAEITIPAAVALGDTKRVRGMIAADPAALRGTLRNGGLLSLAVNHNQLEMVKLLLDLGADVDERVCALFSGLITAFSTSDKRNLGALQEGSRSVSKGSARTSLRKVLLTLEVGLTVVLLIGAGLLLKSYERLRSTDMGCITQDVITMHLGIPDARYTAPAQRANFYDTLLDRVRALPGVDAAGFATVVPGQGYRMDWTFSIVEHPPLPKGSGQFALSRWADAKYFQAMGIPILRGRTFDDSKRLDAANEVIISQSFADRYFPGEDPLGRHLRAEGKIAVIVGIVGDTRYEIGEDPKPVQYYPLDAGEETVGTLVIRSSLGPEQFALPVQRIVSDMDHDLPVSDVLTMNQLLGQSTMNRSFNAALLAAFATLSLVLAAVGLFGVMSYMAAQRTTEIGIRVARWSGKNNYRYLADSVAKS